jgi:hypothetical protein
MLLNIIHYMIFTAMPELLRSAKLAIEKGQAQGRDKSYLKQLSDYIVPALVEIMHKEPEPQICASILESLNESIQVCNMFSYDSLFDICPEENVHVCLRT